MKPVQQWIDDLGLEPHPEGGYYKQTDLSEEMYYTSSKSLPLYTNIYFLLTADNPSHFHRLSSNELWFYHAGSPLTVHSLLPDGSYTQTTLSLDHHLSHTVPAGVIFGSSVDEGYALVSCTVVPGFDFSEFKLFTQSDLLKDYPEHRDIIKKLAYDTLND